MSSKIGMKSSMVKRAIRGRVHETSMAKLISLGLVLMSVSLFATGQATPLKNRCYQYGTTSTTNTQQNGQELSDDYDESYDDQPEASDEPVFDKDVSTEVACSRNAPYCYSLWTFDEAKNVTRVVAQGCWGSSDNHESCSDTECISTMETQNKLFFCCCSGDICNGNFSYAPPPTTLGGLREVDPGGISPYAPESSIWMAPTVYICFALVAIFLLGSVGIFRCRQRPKKGVAELEQMAPSGPGYSANLYNVDNLKLVSMIGQGKYGTVWKGIVNEQPVAVKIFAGQHRQYFLNERDIYTVPLMESPSLLTYFGSDERRTMDDRVEFLLVLSLAPLGCLQDWLVDNRVPFGTFCRMGKSIANGLAHLHTEIRKGHLTKPCICHRDLNTRNILVKADLTCCIGDLGFALKTYGARYEYRGEITLAETKSINEVGTVRYMAPEVLEGAVNLRDCESALKQIDVYTLALVLWELAARCEDFYLPGTPIPEYRAPYEEYVGAHPTFEQMQVLVSRNKARPSFAPHFETSIAARIVRDTCEDCWDHDAEARLTAMCVQERLQEVAQLNPKAQVLVKEHYDDDAIIPPPGTGVKNVLYHQDLQETTVGTGGMGQQLQRYSPDGTTTFLTPPNQQILPPLVAVGGYREDTTGSYGKLINGNSSNSTSSTISTSSTSSRRSAANPNSDEDDDQKQHKHKKDLQVTSDPMKRNLGLNTVKVMLQKTFHKPALHQQLAYETHGRDDCNDDRSNLVVVVEASEGSISVQQQFDSRVMPAEDECGSLKRRPNNLDLGGSGQYESNLLLHDAASVTVDGQYAKLLSGAEFSDHSLLTTMLVAGDGETGVPLGDTLTEQKLRLVVSKSANAMHNTAMADRHGARLLAANVAAAEASEDSRALKRQRSLEVFHEVFAPKGSIERLRNPSQRVKTPGDVPPSVRKVRASKTLSLYDDRMMTVGPGSRLSNSV